MRATLSISRRSAAVMRPISPAASSNFRLRKYSAAYTACATSISRPPTATGTPASSARRMSSVLSGLYTTSSTASSPGIFATSRLHTPTLGYIPAGVVLMTIDLVAGGGQFVTFPEVTKDKARAHLATHVRNLTDKDQTLSVFSQLVDSAGHVIAEAETPITLHKQSDRTVEQDLFVNQPALWHPYTPNLYTLRTQLVLINFSTRRLPRV